MTNITDTPNDNSRTENDSSTHQSERTIFSAEINQEVTDAVRQLSESSPAIGQLLKSNDGIEVVRELTTVAISVVKEHHSGPTPSGRQLREYDAIFPNGADRLFKTVESEQAHRQKMELKIFEYNMTRLQLKQDIQLGELDLKKQSLKVVGERDARSQYFAGGLSTILLIVGMWLIYLGHIEAGVGLIATNFVSIAAVFLTQKWKKADEKEKSKPAPEPD